MNVLNSIIFRYKESISNSTKEWKEKLFSRSSSMADIGSEVRKEVNATVSRMMERLESRDNDSHVPETNSAESSSGAGPSNNSRDTPSDTSLNGKNSASVAASSVSS